MSDSFSSRLTNLLAHEARTQKAICEAAGIGESALVNYKKGRIPKSEELFRLSSELGVSMEFLLTGKESQIIHERGTVDSQTPKLHEEPPPYLAKREDRRIPVVGWAHAGEATDYEELPKDWQEHIPTDCRDASAFAVRLEGDSMLPRFEEGDLLVLMPGEEIYSGALAVVRVRAGGVLFRRVEVRGAIVILIPSNPSYSREEYALSDLAWAFPVWGVWKQLWNR